VVWVGSGSFVWVTLDLQNVTLSVIVKFTQFSELLVLPKLFSVQIKH